MAARDLRLVALRQVVNAIKAVKYYAWEAQYTELVERLRVEELKHLTTARVLTVTSVSVGKAFPVIATCATLVTVALVGDGTLDAADAFATLAIFQQLRLGMVFTPLAVMLLNIYSASFERCQRFLCRPERKPIAQIPPQSANAVEMIDLSVTRSAGDDGQMIDVDSAGVGEYNAAEGADDAPDAALTGYDDVFALHVPSLDIKRGSVVAVVGSVGSGKTTLVDVLTGGVAADTTTNSLRVDSAMGLAPQIAFVVSGTIRDNILMGRPFDKGAFAAACDLADFSIDIGRFSHGIDTTVGEFGTTLSGGQSHRLNIARAVYGHPRLLLLDGSLAAVDPAVARRIFLGVRNYVKANSERAAVLVVSQLHLLPECDQIVYLEGGRVIAQGTYDEMMTNGAFANFCSSYSTGKDDAEEAVPEEEVKRVPQQAATVAPSSKPVTSDVADLVKKEKISRGMVSTLVIRAWLKSLTHVRFAVVMGGMILSMIVMALNDLTLGAWTRDDGSRSIFYMLVYSAFSVGCE
jgi:ABC-type multidrug transport system fused ATPase/permease subunit